MLACINLLVNITCVSMGNEVCVVCMCVFVVGPLISQSFKPVI